MTNKPLNKPLYAAMLILLAAMFWVPTMVFAVAFTVFDLLAAAYLLWRWLAERREARSRP